MSDSSGQRLSILTSLESMQALFLEKRRGSGGEEELSLFMDAIYPSPASSDDAVSAVVSSWNDKIPADLPGECSERVSSLRATFLAALDRAFPSVLEVIVEVAWPKAVAPVREVLPDGSFAARLFERIDGEAIYAELRKRNLDVDWIFFSAIQSVIFHEVGSAKRKDNPPPLRWIPPPEVKAEHPELSDNCDAVGFDPRFESVETARARFDAMLERKKLRAAELGYVQAKATQFGPKPAIGPELAAVLLCHKVVRNMSLDDILDDWQNIAGGKAIDRSTIHRHVAVFSKEIGLPLSPKDDVS